MSSRRKPASKGFSLKKGGPVASKSPQLDMEAIPAVAPLRTFVRMDLIGKQQNDQTETVSTAVRLLILAPKSQHD